MGCRAESRYKSTGPPVDTHETVYVSPWSQYSPAPGVRIWMVQKVGVIVGACVGVIVGSEVGSAVGATHVLHPAQLQLYMVSNVEQVCPYDVQ